MARHPNVAIPSGALFPNGVGIAVIDPAVQATTHRPGSFFQKSPGYQSVRPGRHRLQKGYRGIGINFTPHRFAEDLGQKDLPLMVDEDTASRHADIAELPGSERLDDEGKTTAQEDRILVATKGDAEVAAGTVEERHAHTMDVSGVRDHGKEIVRFSRGLLKNPVTFLSDEYQKTPVKAVVLAALITGAVFAFAGEIERNYNRRRRGRAFAAGAVGGAVVETTGDKTAEVVETPGKAAEAVGDAVQKTTEAVGDAVEKTAEAVAETVS